MELKVKKIYPEAVLPARATDGSACFDICAYKANENHVYHGNPLVCSTGLSFEIPKGYVMLIFSRSGHGFKNDTRLANCVGVIDSDYRGELKVKLTRDGSASDVLAVNHGDRIAQAMIIPIPEVKIVEVYELTDTERGTGGFGSTGK